MASIINATTSTGLVSSADNSGELQLQTNSGTTAVTIDTSQNVTFAKPITVGGNTLGAGNASSFKNRIINGAMTIDQRNAGASVTVTTAQTYGVDRFFGQGSITSKFTAQQSSTVPTGFKNSLLFTSSAATTPSASDYYYFAQSIEGLNVSDLAWGTASASTVTLSFWVRSSLTGTFSGAVLNSATDRSYAFTYTINAANTFEQKTVTIAGDTSGTWLTTNGVGLTLRLALGAGSTFLQTAGSWGTGNVVGATGTTQWISTNGATFYITGVQLEVGSTATSFDYRPYGTELALCQRYYQTLPTIVMGGYGVGAQATSLPPIIFPVTARATATVTPSGTTYSNASGLTQQYVTASSVGYYHTPTASANTATTTTLAISAEL